MNECCAKKKINSNKFIVYLQFGFIEWEQKMRWKDLKRKKNCSELFENLKLNYYAQFFFSSPIRHLKCESNIICKRI